MTEKNLHWREREMERFHTGEYTLPVWRREHFWRYSGHIHQNHFTHVSTTDPGVLAYTENPEKGERDIQTKIKAGRYLKKFFGEILSDKEIKFYANWQTTGQQRSDYHNEKLWSLCFAKTADEIAHVYCKGPHSCMDGTHFTFDRHPTRVYAAGDLAIAYLQDGEGNIKARCLVWPDRQVAGRVYPNVDYWSVDGFASYTESKLCQSALMERLKTAGYRFTAEGDVTFDGARILKKDCPGGYVMPYLDHQYGVIDYSDSYWHMSRGSGESCDSTSGYIETHDNSWTCDRCEERYYDDSCSYQVYTDIRNDGRPHWGYSQNWCEYCTDNHAFRCEGSDYYFADDIDQVEIDGDTYARAWAIANGAYQSERTDEWYFEREDPRVVLEDGTVISTSEMEDGDRLPPPKPHHIEDERQLEVAI